MEPPREYKKLIERVHLRSNFTSFMKEKGGNEMGGIRDLVLRFLYLALVFTLIGPSALTMEDSLENCLLKGEWKKIISILEEDNNLANDSISRLIMGHACLATNRNNESMLLFLSANEENNLNSWFEWTESLKRKYPDNPIVLYLSADANARIGEFKKANELFTFALEKKEDFALAYNARGIVAVLINEWDNAQVDFYIASKLIPDFADAHANLGTLGALRESSLRLGEGALESFNKAIILNPNFALAYNGRGCIYFGSGEFEKAAEDFSIASQLSPTLVIAEINKGLVSAYAGQLITLSNLEKPGTTIESINQQYPNILKEQRQQLQNMIPTQRTKEFWDQMNRFQHLSDDELHSLIKGHGFQKVQMGVFLMNREDAGKAIEYPTKNMALKDRINLHNRWIIGSALVDFTSSLAFSASNLGKSIQKGWNSFFREAAANFGAVGGARIRNHTMQVLTSGLLAHPISSTISSVSKSVQFVAEENRYAAMLEQAKNLEQVATLNTKIRARNERLDQFISSNFNYFNKKSISQIPGYVTSDKRPLTELGALASMVDKGIKPIGDLPRSALIVSQNPFRSSLLQSELSKYGFQTKVSLSGMDPHMEAERVGADVMLGIRSEDPSKKYYYDIMRKSFLNPPDKGGTPSVIQQITKPQTKQNFSWGKPFVPTFGKGAPGGISTKELAESFVDKGNWPVITSFGLLYKATISLERIGKK